MASELHDLIEKELNAADAAAIRMEHGKKGRDAAFSPRLRQPAMPRTASELGKVINRVNYHLAAHGLTVYSLGQGLAVLALIITVAALVGQSVKPTDAMAAAAAAAAAAEEAFKNDPLRFTYFNAHHSPMGAFASFTLGHRGAKGGLGLELAGPADQSVYIMLENRQGTALDALPFFPVASAPSDEGFFSQMGTGLAAEDSAGDSGAHGHPRKYVSPPVFAFPDDAVKREYSLASDVWTAGDMRFAIYSPVRTIPDPATAGEGELKEALVPAVVVEITIDNAASDRDRRVVFGYSGSDPYSGMRHVEFGDRLKGVANGLTTAIITDAKSASSSIGFSIQDVLSASPGAAAANRTIGLGNHAAILLQAPAKEVSTFRFAVCFFRGGSATAGMESQYYYTRYWSSVERVADFALSRFDALLSSSLLANKMVDNQPQINTHQRFHIVHATRSYYGSTQLLLLDKLPYWVVNEGEYRMMNTFDLTVDQLFFELKMNPWTVRNVLDSYVKRYSIQDTVFLPEDPNTQYPGGLSFTHDQGVGNAFSPTGRSAYEQSGLTGLFSHMTSEQLVNWVLCAAAYAARQPDDRNWLVSTLSVFKSAFASLKNRDHPDEAQRDGLMSADSSRTHGGSEITTYDSLDTSLGQARDNLYLGGKTWAAYVALEHVFNMMGAGQLAGEAGDQAEKASHTMANALTEEGYIPAVLKGGSNSKIIPAIEGLVFPLFTGQRDALAFDGRYAAYLRALQRHSVHVLQPGVCIFPDGGWKLSSSSDNSWLSKIYLAQFVARKVLGLPRGFTLQSDEAHASWLLHGKESYWAWSDQMISGTAMGSRYYPRGVTSILWLSEDPPSPPPEPEAEVAAEAAAAVAEEVKEAEAEQKAEEMLEAEEEMGRR